MPAYLFACDCGHKQEVFRPMKDAGKELKCEKCREKMYRDFDAEANGVPIAIWKRPHISEACGVHKKQVKSERERIRQWGLRGVEVLDDGRIKTDSPRARRGYLQKVGMVDRDAYYTG